MKTAFVILVLIGVAAGGSVYYSNYVGGEPAGNFKTAEVKRGDLLLTVNSTGTVEPEEVVDVGAQVQGRIIEFGKDLRADADPRFKDKRVTYASEVDVGQELAKIDDLVYRANLDQAQAALDRATADLMQLEAKQAQTEAEWVRAQKLQDLNLPSLSGITSRQGGTSSPIRGISDSDYVLAKANYDIAKANVAVGKTAISQAKASLKLAETNLFYCTITSPVKGTVIDRRVNVGQTVVASLNAPSLFLIAKDMRRMEVWASVNEADIGKLKKDMSVNFTVDSFPNEVFHGQISQIRLNATMNQNVVLYTVIITTDNSSLRLIPYLTADVKFEIDEKKNVLLVPNAALTWTPRPANISPAFRDHPSATAGAAEPEGRKRGPGAERGGPDSPDGKAAVRAKPKQTRGTLWVKDEEYVRPVEVETGASDGLLTEISGSEINEGLEIITGEIREERGGGASNPFTPQIFRGKGGGRKG